MPDADMDTTSTDRAGADHPACAGCTGDRRDFLLRSPAAPAGIAGAIGLDADAAAALAVRTGGATLVRGGEASYPIPESDGVTIDREREVILARAQGAVYAFALSCPHQNTALRWLSGDGRFQCPKHKSRYAADGTFQSGRATRNMDRLPIRRDGTNVIVNVDTALRSDQSPAEWKDAVVRL